MKKTLLFTMLILCACAVAHAQVQPAATGAELPTVIHKFNYTVNYSGSEEFGGSLGDWQQDTLSAQAVYANGRDRLPFSFAYSGGYTWVPTGSEYGTGFFQVLQVSQGYNSRRWSLNLNDSVSYRPEAPLTGFSGIIGIGEPVTGSGSTSPPTEAILTLNTHTVDNSANANLAARLDYATSLSGGVTSNLLRYPDGNGLDTNGESGDVMLSRRINNRDTVVGQYTYSQFSYPGYSFTFMTNTFLLSDQHTWNRKVQTSVGVGPSFVGSSNSTVAPSSTNFAANGSVSYRMRSDSAGLSYSHGTNGGSGFEFGSQYDAVNGAYSRAVGRDLNLQLIGEYERTSGLQGNEVSNARVGSVQVSRQVGRHLSVYGGYSAVDQSTNLPHQTNVLSGMYQGVSFGLAYSLRGTRVEE